MFPVFLKKTFKIFILEIRVKMILKLGGLRQEGQKGEKCGTFIYYRILSWLWEMHFPAIFECKTHDFPFRPNHVGVSWRLKFRFFTITLVTCLENKALIQRFHQWSPNSEFLQLWKKKIESNSPAARCSIKKLFLLLISFLEKTLIFLTKYFCTVLITLRLL